MCLASDSYTENPQSVVCFRGKHLSNITGNIHYDSLQGSYWADQKDSRIEAGPSPPIKKWSGRGSQPKARDGEEHERGDYSPSRKGGGFGGLPREFFLILSFIMCVFNGGL